MGIIKQGDKWINKRTGFVDQLFDGAYKFPAVDDLLFQLGTAISVNKALNDPNTDAGYTGNVVGNFAVHGIKPDSELSKWLQVVSGVDVFVDPQDGSPVIEVQTFQGSSANWVTFIYSGTHLELTCFINGTPEELDKWWELHCWSRGLNPDDVPPEPEEYIPDEGYHMVWEEGSGWLLVPDEPDNWWDIQAAEFDDDEWADLAGLPIAGGLH